MGRLNRLNKKGRGNGKSKTPLSVGGTSISFITGIERGRKKEWTLEKAQMFTRILQSSGKLDKVTALNIKRDTDMSVSSAYFFFKELREALKRGYDSLEEYFAAGRPCRAGAKKIA